MAPRDEDTPPASPGIFDDPAEDEEVIIGENEAFEVIDIDEVHGLEDDDEDDGDGERGETTTTTTTDGAAAAAPAAELEPPPEDNSELIFSKHEKSVFCCHVHPRNDNQVVSGGEDDQAFVWDTKSGDILFGCDGFKDSVTHAQFSHDGSFLAVADMSGVIKVWKTSNKSVIWDFETSDITWMEWHYGSNVLFVGTVESELWMWKIPTGESKVYQGHGERVETAKLLPDGKRIVVGYSDGTLRLFDLKTGNVVHNLSGGNLSHKAAISVIDVSSDNNLIASGGLDGAAKIFHIQSGKNVATLEATRTEEDESKSSSSSSSECKSAVECILFSKDQQLNQVVTGTLDGRVTVWDVSTQHSRHSEVLGSGIVKILWRIGVNGQLLVANLEGLVLIYDTIAGKVLGECSGHTAAILDIQQSRDGKKVISTSDDGTCRVFDIDKILSEGCQITIV